MRLTINITVTADNAPSMDEQLSVELDAEIYKQFRSSVILNESILKCIESFKQKLDNKGKHYE